MTLQERIAEVQRDIDKLYGLPIRERYTDAWFEELGRLVRLRSGLEAQIEYARRHARANS